MCRITLGIIAGVCLLGSARSATPATPRSLEPLPPSRQDQVDRTAETTDRDAPRAARDLLQRLLPDAVDQFVLEGIKPVDGHDVFEIESQGDQVVIRGNSAVSMATGLNWYLNHFCHCHVSLHGRQLNLPDPLPQVAPKVRRVSWSRSRYFLNYCCFGYSLPWYDWDQWEALIDWMALHGINMPLAVTGQEVVWQAVCRRLGMDDDEIAAFLAGPPYLPFQWMGCLDGWGGPLPPSWMAGHQQLQQKILNRQRQLGMTPVLQGFTGHVPAAVARKYPAAQLHRIRWIEWETHLLDPLDPLFARVAKMFLEEQSKRYGTDHLYAADTFIEMTPPRGEAEYLDRLSRAIYHGMVDSDPQAVWVLQGWTFMYQRSFWTQPRIEAFLNAVPNDRMIVLDLYCESRPMWNQTQAFYGKPWVWCNIQNFGNIVQLGGALDKIANDIPAARTDPDSGQLVGLGFVNEGLGYNPVVFDLMYEMAWRNEPVKLDEWIADYVFHRYGQPNRSATAAWQQLLAAVYRTPASGRSMISQLPTIKSGNAAAHDQGQLVTAWHALLQASAQLGDVDTFRYDLVNVNRQVLANHAAVLHQKIVRASEAQNAEALKESSQRFLQLIHDLDQLLATRREFLLGRCLEDAKSWGTSDAERARLQWNARRVLTLWGQGPAIDDYARKQWSGMLDGYYGPRWKRYLAAVIQAVERRESLDNEAFAADLRQWMGQWSDGRETYPNRPHGDSVTVSKTLWKKYGDALTPKTIDR